MKTVIAMVLTLVLSGCLKPETDSAILVMGDSISQQIVANLSGHILFRDNAPMVFNNSIGGLPLAAQNSGQYWAGRITQAKSISNLEAITVALLGNDGSFYTAEDDHEAEVADAFRQVMYAAGDTPVYWVIPSVEVVMNLHEELRGYAYEAASLYENLHIIEVPLGSLAEDELHLSPVGIMRVSHLIRVALGLEKEK